MAAFVLLIVVCLMATPVAVKGVLRAPGIVYGTYDRNTIYGLDLAGFDVSPLLANYSAGINRINYDHMDGKVYWSHPGGISYAYYDGRNPADVCPAALSTARPIEAFVVDGEDRLLFYATERESGIASVSLDRCTSTRFVPEYSNFMDIKLSWNRRRVYFTARTPVMALRRMDYYGRNVVELYRPSNNADINGIAVDEDASRVYFCQMSEKKIMSINFDKTGLQQVYAEPQPFCLHLTLVADMLGIVYDDQIALMGKDGSSYGKLPRDIGRVSDMDYVGRTPPLPTTASSLTTTPLATTTPLTTPLATTTTTSATALHPAQAWIPAISCQKGSSGTSVKVSRGEGLEDFSLLVMDPPGGCSRDLGQFRNDVTVPESCVVDETVVVALQLTEIKQVFGGRYFRMFRFTCNDLGTDGEVKEISTGTNPDETDPVDSSTNYADGSFSLLVELTSNVESQRPLSTAGQLSWSQGGVSLVIQHRLAAGSLHRTLIPLECETSSTSHPDLMTFWLSRVGHDCRKLMGLIDDWVIRSKRTNEDDVTYVPMYPYDFKVGENVTISCSVHECPYVTSPNQLQGRCKQSYDKFASCGGSFQRGQPVRRAAPGFVERDESGDKRGSAVREEEGALKDDATRVMSTTFTWV